MSPIRFIHITDSHLGPTEDFNLQGVVTAPRLHEVLQFIKNIPATYDFVIHTGDIVSDPDVESYKLPCSFFQELDVPWYFIPGNHDSSVLIENLLWMD